MKQKVIVTGGCGYIGSHTVIELINNNYEVVIADDLSNSSYQILDRIEKITAVRPDFSEVDLKSSIATQEFFKNHKNAIKQRRSVRFRLMAILKSLQRRF